jgi:DTW domain-containing protein YfiP
MHCAERNKPSNTARLAELALPNVEVRLQGEMHKPLDLSGLEDPERELLILYPEASAPLLSPEFASSLEKPVTLLVPDGTWKQAKKIAALATERVHARRVCVPFDAPSRYVLRSADRSNRLCTLEAIARALGALESPAVQESLESLLDEMVRRSLISRANRRPVRSI